MVPYRRYAKIDSEQKHSQTENNANRTDKKLDRICNPQWSKSEIQQ